MAQDEEDRKGEGARRPVAAAKADGREARLAKALRDNLRRRKAAARPAPPPPSED